MPWRLFGGLLANAVKTYFPACLGFISAFLPWWQKAEGLQLVIYVKLIKFSGTTVPRGHRSRWTRLVGASARWNGEYSPSSHGPWFQPWFISSIKLMNMHMKRLMLTSERRCLIAQPVVGSRCRNHWGQIPLRPRDHFHFR